MCGLAKFATEKKQNIMNKSILVIAMMLMAVLPAAAFTRNKMNNIQDMENKRTLVVFFSRTGENYAVGNIKKGNTHIVAEVIAEETGGALFQIEPLKAYPEDYTKCTEVAKEEVESKARPAVKGDIAVEDYDIIFIGYPNWLGDAPMPVYTFIERHNWQGKTVIPFCTHEGSGLGSTESKLRKTCEGATFRKGLAVRGATAQKSQDQARKVVTDWLNNF